MFSPRSALLLACAGLLALATPAFAVPQLVPLQAGLRTVGGSPVPDGKYIVTVKLYAAPDAKDPFFKEIHFNVATSAGALGLAIGSVEPDVNPLPVAKLVASPTWVGVSVDSDPELPRQPLLSVPYALVAGTAELASGLQCSGCVATDLLADGAVTTDKLANSAVTAAKVAFAYAASNQKGGVADAAATLQCTGCVGSAHLAKAAVGADQLAEEAVGPLHLQTAAVQPAHLAKATLDALHDWQALQNVPAGFADGADDTLTVDGLKAALKDNAVDLNGGSTLGGAPVVRMHTGTLDDLADKAFLEVDTGTTSPLVAAQAWFADKDGVWYLANSGTDAQAASCTACGTGADGDYNPQGNATLAGGTYNFKSFTIKQGVTITVTGTKPLVVQSLGPVTIAGALVANGAKGSNVTANYDSGTYAGGPGGPGGYAGGKGCYGCAGEAGFGPGGGQGSPNTGYAGGGGGGSYGTQGSNGTAGSSGSFGNAGNVYGDPLLASFQGGSGGGAGGYGSGINASGAGGGGGGGAIQLVGSTVTLTGTVQANGGNGGSMVSNGDGGGGGGGSGGAIWLRGTQVAISGTVQALGGTGGTKGSSSGPGGNGGQGRIRVDANDVTGASTPAFAKGATTGLELPLVNKFLITQPKPGVVRLTNQSGGVQKVRLVVLR